jgi:hypothetical protein
MSTWFKYYRSSAEHHLRSKPLVWIYWLHCLECAAWKTHDVFWDQQEFCLEQGSFITSMQRDSTKNGITIAAVRYARKVLTKCDMIEVTTTNKGTLIKVNQWKEFQKKQEEENASRKQATNKPTTNEEQTSNKRLTTTVEGIERKEGKRRKRITTAAPEYSEAFEKFWKVYPKHEDKAEAFQLYQEIISSKWGGLDGDDLEKTLLKFAFAYASEFSRGRKRFAKKAKYILRDAEWYTWMSENHFEYHMGNETREEPKPAATGIASLSAYTMAAKTECPGIDPKDIRAAFDSGLHIKQLIQQHQTETTHD